MGSPHAPPILLLAFLGACNGGAAPTTGSTSSTAAGVAGVACVEGDDAVGVSCLPCSAWSGDVQCNYSTRVTDCGSSNPGPGPISDCRDVACTCHACLYNDPSPCGPPGNGCGGPCHTDADCVQAVHAYAGVDGIRCIGNACLWAPMDGGTCPPGGAP